MNKLILIAAVSALAGCANYKHYTDDDQYTLKPLVVYTALDGAMIKMPAPGVVATNIESDGKTITLK